MNPGNLTRILVVEDNVDDSFLLTRQLARADMGDGVTVIGNGQDALDFLLKVKIAPLVVFLDLRLPGLSGLKLLERMRQLARLECVPVIVMTTSIAPGDVEECSRLGVTAYLPKPVGLATFLKIVGPLSPKAQSAR